MHNLVTLFVCIQILRSSTVKLIVFVSLDFNRNISILIKGKNDKQRNLRLLPVPNK